MHENAPEGSPKLPRGLGNLGEKCARRKIAQNSRKCTKMHLEAPRSCREAWATSGRSARVAKLSEIHENARKCTSRLPEAAARPGQPRGEVRASQNCPKFTKMHENAPRGSPK